MAAGAPDIVPIFQPDGYFLEMAHIATASITWLPLNAKKAGKCIFFVWVVSRYEDPITEEGVFGGN